MDKDFIVRAFGKALFIVVALLLLIIAFCNYVYPISLRWRFAVLIGLGIILIWLTIMLCLDPPEDWD